MSEGSVHSPPAVHPAVSKEDQKTRAQILEAAGQIFAEKGFERTTGREIAMRAGANTAAINYYFGGVEGLYASVLHAAHDRFVTFQALSAAVAGLTTPQDRLRAVIDLIIRTLTGPISTSWAVRVLGREFIAPSPASRALRENEFVPKMRLLRQIVSDIMQFPPDHAAVSRACINVMAPFAVLLIGDHATILKIFPIGLDPANTDVLVHHMHTYALAGLAAVAADWRKQNRPGASSAPGRSVIRRKSASRVSRN